MEFAQRFNEHIELINKELGAFTPNVEAPFFYDPIRYVLDLKGKRIRPLLTLLSAEAAGGEIKEALPAATAVELLHNFTLVHDDIMDEDELRRGFPTVHHKWDLSTAILAGDGLMGLAFQKLLESRSGDIKKMMEQMVKTMIIICEGQALDKTFENRQSITATEYLDMIARKTAVLLELSCELGGRAIECNAEIIEKLRNFGYNLGLGFQIQDDLLDVIAVQEDLGKKVGSDLQMHKQTLLTIRLKEKIQNDSFYELPHGQFKVLLKESGVQQDIEDEYNLYFTKAFEAIDDLPATGLKNLAGLIKDRRW